MKEAEEESTKARGGYAPSNATTSRARSSLDVILCFPLCRLIAEHERRLSSCEYHSFQSMSSKSQDQVAASVPEMLYSAAELLQSAILYDASSMRAQESTSACPPRSPHRWLRFGNSISVWHRIDPAKEVAVRVERSWTPVLPPICLWLR